MATAQTPSSPSEQSRPAPPSRHYLGALVITLIVTGLAFFIKDPSTKWLVLAVAIVMDLSVIAVALKPAPRGDD
jgi:hypothetical protein